MRDGIEPDGIVGLPERMVLPRRTWLLVVAVVLSVLGVWPLSHPAAKPAALAWEAGPLTTTSPATTAIARADAPFLHRTEQKVQVIQETLARDVVSGQARSRALGLALLLVQDAQNGMRHGDNGLAERAQLRNTAVELIQALHREDLPAARSFAAALAAPPQDQLPSSSEPVVLQDLVSLEDVMGLLKLRGREGWGIGDREGVIPPDKDGMEAMIQALAKRPPAAVELRQQQVPLEEMAQRVRTLADVVEAFTPKRGLPWRRLADWKAGTQDMKDSSEDLAQAIRAADPAAVQTAAGKLNKSCGYCHGCWLGSD